MKSETASCHACQRVVISVSGTVRGFEGSKAGFQLADFEEPGRGLSGADQDPRAVGRVLQTQDVGDGDVECWCADRGDGASLEVNIVRSTDGDTTNLILDVTGYFAP